VVVVVPVMAVFFLIAFAVLLGATIDYFIPAARSLPHAIQLIRG
jgi:hypothetical protein